MMWVPDAHFATVSGTQKASAFEAFLQALRDLSQDGEHRGASQVWNRG